MIFRVSSRSARLHRETLSQENKRERDRETDKDTKNTRETERARRGEEESFQGQIPGAGTEDRMYEV